MHDLIQTLKDTILSPKWYIEMGGLYMILFVVFAETGLFVGFFLPGDSLLFVAGLFIDDLAREFFDVPYVLIMLMVAIAGVLGNAVGYWFGKKSGPFLYNRKDSFFFKQRHLNSAKRFYEKNGALTVIAARFIPIIRTFVPIVAGIVKMDKRKFTLYNIIGSFAWVFSMMMAGHLLGKQFPWIKDRIEVIVILIILVTTLPVIIKFALGGKKEEEPV
ncbi:MAG TPA: VTT domain-containing protein [Chitinophagaceae bacterium]|nr:VTT domain-containing protein [Chitinophagaceae bacterium]HNF72044.1 VTT domain-containing protein [Chitinophagaceae bacterium]